MILHVRINPAKDGQHCGNCRHCHPRSECLNYVPDGNTVGWYCRMLYVDLYDDMHCYAKGKRKNVRHHTCVRLEQITKGELK